MNIITNATSPISALAFVKLKKPGTRGKTEDINQILGEVNQNYLSFQLPIFSLLHCLRYKVLAIPMALKYCYRTGPVANSKTSAAPLMAFIGELMKREEIAYAFTTFNTGNPQYKVNIDESKARQLGVSMNELLQTLQVYYGSYQASDFNRFGKQYKVIMQSDIAYRVDPATLNAVNVKNNAGQMIPGKNIDLSRESIWP
jgi:HAE1 family hydrophobic/amphiphilic exporter-1